MSFIIKQLIKLMRNQYVGCRADTLLEPINRQPCHPVDDHRIQPCQLASEWAEHARMRIPRRKRRGVRALSRFNEDDEPCEDGRTGAICGHREGKKPCQI